MNQVASVLCLQYMWILPSLVQEILSGREGGTMSFWVFCVLWSRKARKCILFAEFSVQHRGLKGWGGACEIPGVTTLGEIWRDTCKSAQGRCIFFYPPSTTGVTLAVGQLAAWIQARGCQHWPGIALTPCSTACSNILTPAAFCWPRPASCLESQQLDHSITISIQAVLCKAFYLALFLALLCIPSNSKPANRCGAAVFASKMFTPGSL